MKRLNSQFQVAIISLGITFILFGLTLPLMLIDLIEISLGILLGGIIGGASYFFFGLADSKQNEAKSSLTVTIIIMIVKFIILAIVMFVVGMAYYKYDFHYFNLFSVVGGYFISLICYIIITLREGKRAQ